MIEIVDTWQLAALRHLDVSRTDDSDETGKSGKNAQNFTIHIMPRTRGENNHDSGGNRSVWCTFKKRKRIRPLLRGRV